MKMFRVIIGDPDSPEVDTEVSQYRLLNIVKKWMYAMDAHAISITPAGRVDHLTSVGGRSNG